MKFMGTSMFSPAGRPGSIVSRASTTAIMAACLLCFHSTAQAAEGSDTKTDKSALRTVYAGWYEHTAAFAPYVPGQYLVWNRSVLGILDLETGRTRYFESPWDREIHTLRLDSIAGERYLMTSDGEYAVIDVGGLPKEGSRTALATQRYAYYQAPLQQSHRGKLQTDRSVHTVERVGPDEFLLIGGLIKAASTESTEFFNVSSLTARNGPSMKLPRQGHASVRLRNGGILVVGGSGASANTTELFDPATKRWIDAGRLNAPRTTSVNSRVQLAELGDGRVMVLGGDPGYRTFAELWSPHAKSWSPAVPLLFKRQNTQLIPQNDGSVLVAGGTDQTRVTELFWPENNSWVLGPETPVPWTVSSSLGYAEPFLRNAVGKIVQAKRGLDAFGTNVYGELERSTAGSGRLLAPRWRHTAIRLADGRVLVTGGLSRTAQSGPAAVVRAAEIYDPQTGRSVSTGSPNLLRLGHEMVLLPDGRVALLGGQTKDTGSWQSPEQLPVEVWRQDTGLWLTIKTIAMEDNDIVLTMPDGKLLVFRTESSSSSAQPSTQIYEWNAPKGSLELVGRLPKARIGFSTKLAGAEEVHLIGGYEVLEPVEVNRECAQPCEADYSDEVPYVEAQQDLVWNVKTSSLRMLGVTRATNRETVSYRQIFDNPTPRTASLVASLPEGQVLYYRSRDAQLWHYAPATGGHWKLLPMPDVEGAQAREIDLSDVSKRRFHYTATPLGAGRLLIVGGVTDPKAPNGSLPIAEVLLLTHGQGTNPVSERK